MPSLTAYGGYRNVWLDAANKQQAALRAAVLPVPSCAEEEPIRSSEAPEHAAAPCWPAVLALAEQQPAALSCMPKHSGDKALNRRHRAFVQSVLPSPVPAPTPPQQTTAASSGHPGAGRGDPPLLTRVASLRDVTLQHLAASDTSSSSMHLQRHATPALHDAPAQPQEQSGPARHAVVMLQLDAPVFTAAADKRVWGGNGASTCQQERPGLLPCGEELRQELPADYISAEALALLHTEVALLPNTPASSSLGPAFTSLDSLIRAWGQPRMFTPAAASSRSSSSPDGPGKTASAAHPATAAAPAPLGAGFPAATFTEAKAQGSLLAGQLAGYQIEEPVLLHLQPKMQQQGAAAVGAAAASARQLLQDMQQAAEGLSEYRAAVASAIESLPAPAGLQLGSGSSNLSSNLHSSAQAVAAAAGGGADCTLSFPDSLAAALVPQPISSPPKESGATAVPGLDAALKAAAAAWGCSTAVRTSGVLARAGLVPASTQRGAAPAGEPRVKVAASAPLPASSPAATVAAAGRQAGEQEGGSSAELPQQLPGMLLEVPVCAPAQLCPATGTAVEAALRLAVQVLELRVTTTECSQEATPAVAAEWDGSWGDMSGPAGDTGVPWWNTRAALHMMAGAAGLSIDAAAATLPSAVRASADGRSSNTTGAALVEELLAEDMDLVSDGLLLPVPLLLDAAAGVGAAAAAAVAAADLNSNPLDELLQGCRYRRQSTAHLELYMDWSLLQELQHEQGWQQQPGSCLAGAAAGGSKWGRSHSQQAAAADPGRKRARAGDAGPALLGGVGSSKSDGFDVLAWLPAAQARAQCGLQQHLCNVELASSAGPGAADAGSCTAKSGWQHLLRELLPPAAASNWRRQQGQPNTAALRQGTAAAGPAAAGSSRGVPTAEEQVPPLVAAAAAAWRAKHCGASSSSKPASAGAAPATGAAAGGAQQSMAEQRVPAVSGTHRPAAAATAAATAGAAERDSDMSFFMQLQGMGGGRSSSRAGTAKRPLPQHPAAATDATDAAAAGCSKKARVAASTAAVPAAAAEAAHHHPAAAQDGSTRIQQQQLDEAGAAADNEDTADLALPGACRRQAAAAGARRSDAAAAAADAEEQQPQPVELRVELPHHHVQLLRTLERDRQAVLALMHPAGPQLTACQLWDDLAAQQLLGSYQATGVPLPPELRQQAKQLVVLLLLSQAAACLLHYGVRVAHLFLQHGLQKLPSVAAGCQGAASALAAAYGALEQQQAPAAAGLVDHPKLQRLQELLQHLARRKQGLKVLLVAESKAFFSLLGTLSAAGLAAAQLDKGKQLPAAAEAAAAAGANASDAGLAPAGAAWEAAVAAALAASRCVLLTKGQLCSPLMPLAQFDVLIEYSAPDDTACSSTGSASSDAAAAADRLHVVARQFSGRHYRLTTALPDLSAVPADAAAEVVADLRAQAAARSGQQQQPHPRTLPVAAEEPAAVTAAAGDEEPGPAAAGCELPLVLNRSSGSILRRRRLLYESLLQQLEGRGGFVLVERLLSGAAAGIGSSSGLNAGHAGGTGAAAAAAGGGGCDAVDVVLSPAACLCVWDQAKLPQEAGQALQQLLGALHSLGSCYAAAFFVLELPAPLMRQLLRQGPALHGAAAQCGVRLQLLCSHSPATTQDMVLGLCRSVATSFWAASPSSSSSSSTAHTPPALSDIPAPAEALLSCCCGMNPLSAAVLAGCGLSLKELSDRLACWAAATADAAAGQPQAAEGGKACQQLPLPLDAVPLHSLQLLAAQLTATHLQLECSPERPVRCGRQVRAADGGWLQQQQQQEDVHQQHDVLGQPWQQQEWQQDQLPALQQWEREQQDWQQPQQRQQHQQRQWDQQQQWDQEEPRQLCEQEQQLHDAGGGPFCQPAKGPSCQLQRPAERQQWQPQHNPHSNAWQQQQQQQEEEWLSELPMESELCWQQQPQQQHPRQQLQQCQTATADIDPSGVLDDFLSRRYMTDGSRQPSKRPRAGMALAAAGLDGASASASAWQQQQRPAGRQRRQQEQQQQSHGWPAAAAAAAGANDEFAILDAGDVGGSWPPPRQQQQQQWQQQDFDDLPDIAPPFLPDVDASEPTLFPSHARRQQKQQQQQQRPPWQQQQRCQGMFAGAAAADDDDGMISLHHQQQQRQQQPQVWILQGSERGVCDDQQGMLWQQGLRAGGRHQQEPWGDDGCQATAGPPSRGGIRPLLHEAAAAAAAAGDGGLFEDEGSGFQGSNAGASLWRQQQQGWQQDLGGAAAGRGMFGSAASGFAAASPEDGNTRGAAAARRRWQQQQQQQQGGPHQGQRAGQLQPSDSDSRYHHQQQQQQQQRLDGGLGGSSSSLSLGCAAGSADGMMGAAPAAAGGAGFQLQQQQGHSLDEPGSLGSRQQGSDVAGGGRSRRFAEAFMPHRNPTKQLTYTKAGAVKKLVAAGGSRRGGTAGGGRKKAQWQTKLRWG